MIPSVKKPKLKRKKYRPSRRQLLDNRGVKSIIGEIEDAAGGRTELLGKFDMLALDGEMGVYVEKLRGWGVMYPDAPLHRGVAEVGMSFKQFMALYREAVLAPFKLQAELELAKEMPAVVAQTVDEAKEVWKTCYPCRGKGFIAPEDCEKCDGAGEVEGKKCFGCNGKGKTKAKVCGHCEGRGKLEMKLNMESRKLAFEAAGMTGKGREVTVAIQNNLTLPAMEDAVKRLPEAIDVLPEGD